MKASFALLFVFGVFGLVGCSTVPESGRSQLMLVSEGEEAQMGLASFTDIKAHEKVSTNAAANAQVNRVGERIAKSVGRELPNAQWEFVVFESDDVNAFALPGGKVGVYTGLLKLVASDDELATVMGHEIAHVTSRHGAERTSQNMLISGMGTVGKMAMDYKGVDAAKRDAVMSFYGLGSEVGVLLPYSRAHETEADSIGLRFAAGAGYDPRAAAAFWKKMAAASGSSSTPVLLSTHPSNESRIENLEKLAPQYMAIYEQAKAQYR